MVNKPTEVKAFTGELSQAETNYVPLSPKPGVAACASCRWFLAYGDCYIVEDFPEPILATGYCDRHEDAPEPQPDATEVLADAIVEALEDNADVVSEAVYSSMPMDMGKALEQPGVMERIWNGLKEYITPNKAQSDLVVLKGADGKNYWLASFTNNFIDREDEILSEHAHKEFEQRLDMKLTPMPELWAWHTEGTRHGKALSVWYQDHNMFAIGEFDDTTEAKKAVEYYRKTPVKLSHGFVAPTWAFKNGVYDSYNTFEISTLPPKVAANPYTSFEEIKAMPVPESREAFIKELFGATAADVLAKVNAKTDASKALSELVEFKDFSSTVVKPTATDTETTKSLGVLFSEVVEQQTELINFVKAQAIALTAKDTTIATLKTEKDTEVSQLRADIKALQTLVNAPPQRPSQSVTTVVDPKTTTLKDATPADDPAEKFFGVPMKKVVSN